MKCNLLFFLPALNTVAHPIRYPNSAIHGQAPTLAGAPPTILLFETFEYPQPSSGVNKRPLISVLTTVLGGECGDGDGVVSSSPN